jgi:hypothetical protein
MKPGDSNREDQAKRDLARLEREREKLLHGSTPADDDDNDPAVIRGKRIARILGPIVAAGLILYLLATYLPRP